MSATPLTVYGQPGAAADISTANNMVNVGGATGTNSSATLIGTSTGYGEVYSQGNGGAWGAAGALPAQSGRGFLWDVTTLEARSLVAGSYTPDVRLSTDVGSVTADIICRYSIWHKANNTYTTLATCTLTAQTINTTWTTYTAPSVMGALAPFASGDKLYCDVFLNITANSTGSGTAHVRIGDLGLSGLGAAGNKWITPGYVLTAGQNYTATIGGTLVNIIAGTLNVTNQIGQRSQGSMRVWSALNTAWLYGTRVLVYDDTGALVYAGYTTKDKVSKPGGAMQGSGVLEHDIQLMDNCYRADKRRAFKSYLGTSAGAIVQDLLNTYLIAEGVNNDTSGISNGAVITEVIWNGNKSVAEAMTWLATQSGYWWQIDLNGKLWFSPYGGVSAPWTLDGTQVDSAANDLSVEYGNDMFINSEFVKGSFAETGTLTETLPGDGNRRSFTLSYEVSKILSVVVNPGGIDETAKSLTKGSSGGFWYYAKGDAVIAQDTGQTVLSTSQTITVTYKGRYPVLANAKNSGLIAAQQTREGGGTGLVESTYTNTKVRTVSAAFGIANALLTHYGADTTLLTFTTRQKGLMPGQMLTVQLSDFAGLASKQMLISSVRISDQQDGINIWFTVQAVGSPVESAQWQTYWSNLMQQSSDPSDYTDLSDQALALLTSSSFTNATNTFHVTQQKTSCPIIGPSLLIGPTVIVC